MVELADRNNVPSINQVTAGVAQMLDAGMEGSELLNMIQTIVQDHKSAQENRGHDGGGYDGNTVFIGELPEGLIDIPTAAEKYNCPKSRIQNWVQRGRLATYGRRKAPARGGGYLVLREDELLDYLSQPPNKGGRPSKT